MVEKEGTSNIPGSGLALPLLHAFCGLQALAFIEMGNIVLSGKG